MSDQPPGHGSSPGQSGPPRRPSGPSRPQSSGRPPPRPPPQSPPRPRQRSTNPPKSRDPYDYDQIFDEPNEPRTETIGLRDRIPVPLVKRVGAGVLAVLVLLIVASFIRHQFEPSGRPGNEVIVQIPAGTSTAGIGTILHRHGVIPSSLAFHVWVKLTGQKSFRSGEYDFNQNESVNAALAVLKNGPKTPTDRLVIPEGSRVVQIAQLVGNLPGMSAQRFLQLADGGTVRSAFEPPNVTSLEGFLFPDTYLLSPGDTEAILLQEMVQEFDNEARILKLDQSQGSNGHDAFATLVIAAMIESEAKVPEDRGKISQVIENRLHQNMPLQIDETIFYALGHPPGKTTLTGGDLKVNSPYNTYANLGLPPGPIANPGEASLKAALSPTPGPWLYYVVTDGSGAHSFATTLEEQNRNIAVARQKGLMQ